MRDWTENQIELYLIRHGETASNREHRYLGRTEEPLDREGIQKLAVLWESRTYPQVEICFSSPMVRCVESCGILFPERTPLVIPDWREMDFGDFEGKNYRELSGNPEYQAWIDSNGTLPFPHGESREVFTERCVRGYQRMWEVLKARPRIKQAAAVVHGGTIMAVLSRLYGGEYYDYQVKNGGGYRCLLSRETPGKITEIEEWK